MDKDTWHVFHFIGHGGFDRNTDEGFIALADEDGRTSPLGAGALRRLLSDHPRLRLVVLNACDTGRASAVGAFSSTASVLSREGIPAVVAMQFEITDRAATEFARAFYRTVAKQLPLDVCVMRARRAVEQAHRNTLEWGTPVLYLRSPDGHIFDLGTPAPLPPQQAEPTEPAQDSDPLSELYDEGLAAFWTERWDQAVDIFRQIVARRADDAGARTKLDLARRQQELAARYAQGCATADAQAWDQAVAHLTAVLQADPGYRDAQQRLEHASHHQSVTELHAQARRLYRAKQWAAVLKIGEELEALDPDAADPDELVTPPHVSS